MPTREQFDRVEKLIWGLYIFIPLAIIFTYFENNRLHSTETMI